jgi:hypothetical protein
MKDEGGRGTTNYSGEEKGTMTSADEKKWSMPKLRVFIRAREDEKVLGNCKASGVSNVYTLDVGCMQKWQCIPRCYQMGTT